MFSFVSNKQERKKIKNTKKRHTIQIEKQQTLRPYFLGTRMSQSNEYRAVHTFRSVYKFVFPRKRNMNGFGL